MDHSEFQNVERLRERLQRLEDLVVGTPDEAGLVEQVEALLRFVGGSVVVSKASKTVTVARATR